MPRTPHKGPLDFSEAAHAVMDQVIAKADPDAVDAKPATDTEAESPHVAAGRMGGEARAKALTPTRRAAIAQHAATERWAAERA